MEEFHETAVGEPTTKKCRRGLFVRIVCTPWDKERLERRHGTESLDGRVAWKMLDKLHDHGLDWYSAPPTAERARAKTLFQVTIPEERRGQDPDSLGLIYKTVEELGDVRVLNYRRNEILIQLRS